MPNEIPIVAHNTTYDHHFIIKQLAEEFKSQFKCTGEMMKNILLFQYQLKKKMIMVKQSHINYNLLITLDLCQPHYEVLLITYLKFIKKNAKHARKEKIFNQNVILLSLKIINYVTNVKNVKTMVKTNI